jgi:hypothetical protein
MFQYQGTAISRPLLLSMLIDGGSQPDLRSSDSGKVSTGAARIGTPMKRSTAPSATPSLASKSSLTRSVLISQAGMPSPLRSQLV